MGIGSVLFTAQSVLFGVALPALLAGLFLFNFWFTVNRLRSTARIVAYIQVVLESNESKWIGWETSLRKYRIWKKGDPQIDPNDNRKIIKNKTKEAKKRRNQFVDNELDKVAVPDALMHYPPIYLMHITLIVLCIIIGIILIQKEPSTLNIFSAFALILFVSVFAWHCWKFRPSRMRRLIERNVVIWNHALGLKGQKSGGIIVTLRP